MYSIAVTRSIGVWSSWASYYHGPAFTLDVDLISRDNLWECR